MSFIKIEYFKITGAGNPRNKTEGHGAAIAVAVIFVLLFAIIIAGCGYIYYKHGNLFGYTYTKGIGIHKMDPSSSGAYMRYVDKA